MDLKLLICFTFLLTSHVTLGNTINLEQDLETDENEKITQKGYSIQDPSQSIIETIGKLSVNRTFVLKSPLDQDSLISLRQNLIKNAEYYKNPSALTNKIKKFIDTFVPNYLQPLFGKLFKKLNTILRIENDNIDKMINVEAILPNINYLLNENGIELKKGVFEHESLIEISDKPTDVLSFQNLRHLLLEQNEVLTNPCNLKHKVNAILNVLIPKNIPLRDYFINRLSSYFSFEIPLCDLAGRLGFGSKSINVETILPGINYIIKTIHEERLYDGLYNPDIIKI